MNFTFIELFVILEHTSLILDVTSANYVNITYHVPNVINSHIDL